ncbi:MAG: hypothetical protein O2887_05590 [Bacteroidetes bacterium]|nr:hypothetical protein [Bacteroidota bacterium]MDA1119954.1 hypothetical protein [Bacteroidota bacterium]
MDKQRIIKSYEKLDNELIKQFEDTYPDGYNDKVLRITNSKNENFFVAPLETENAIYLVKVKLAKAAKIKEEKEDDFEDSDNDEVTEPDSASDKEDSKEVSYEDDYDLD